MEKTVICSSCTNTTEVDANISFCVYCGARIEIEDSSAGRSTQESLNIKRSTPSTNVGKSERLRTLETTREVQAKSSNNIDKSKDLAQGKRVFIFLVVAFLVLTIALIIIIILLLSSENGNSTPTRNIVYSLLNGI